MAVLNRDDFFARMQERMGDDTSDEAISFLEDMTDTYNDLESRANGDGVDWEQKYKDNDAAWKAKYRHRFFNGDNRNVPMDDSTDDSDVGTNAEAITVDDLFKKEG